MRVAWGRLVLPARTASASRPRHVGATSPLARWEWVGGLPGVRISYDHRFESSGRAATRLEWLVELHGPLAPLIRPVFARVYGRNLDRAIPILQEWFRR
jgi:hypothetical protein